MYDDVALSDDFSPQ